MVEVRDIIDIGDGILSMETCERGVRSTWEHELVDNLSLHSCQKYILYPILYPVFYYHDDANYMLTSSLFPLGTAAGTASKSARKSSSEGCGLH